MTTVDIAVSVGSVAISIIGILYALHVARTSGRDRPRDPEAVRRLVERAKKFPEYRDLQD